LVISACHASEKDILALFRDCTAEGATGMLGTDDVVDGAARGASGKGVDEKATGGGTTGGVACGKTVGAERTGDKGLVGAGGRGDGASAG